MGRFQKALIGGRRASFWLYADDCLVLRSRDKLVEVKVPVADLADDEKMRSHYNRVTALGEVEASFELHAIALGART